MKVFDKTWKLALSGVVIGLLVMLLAMSGRRPTWQSASVSSATRQALKLQPLHPFSISALRSSALSAARS